MAEYLIDYISNDIPYNDYSMQKKINTIDIWSYIFLDKSDLNSVRDCMRFVTFHRTSVGSLQKSVIFVINNEGHFKRIREVRS